MKNIIFFFMFFISSNLLFAISCNNLLTKKREFSTQLFPLKNFIPHEWRNDVSIFYNTTFSFYNHLNLVSYVKEGTKSEKSEYFNFLESIGFRIDRSTSNEFSLINPNNLETLENLYRKILEVKERNNLTTEDLILPSMVFFKVEDQKWLYQLVRVGIDSFPNKEDGWNLLRNGNTAEMKLTEYAKNIAEGKMPFHGQMIFHDIGHILDFLNNPMAMPSMKKFYKRILASSKNGSRLEDLLETKLLKRSEYFFEVATAINLSKKNQIRSYLKTLPIQSVSKHDLNSFFNNLPEEQFLNYISDFLYNSKSWIQSVGGGQNDPYSYLQFTQTIYSLNLLKNTFLRPLRKKYKNELKSTDFEENKITLPIIDHFTLGSLTSLRALAILITKNYYRLDVEHLDYYKPNTSFVNLIYKNFPNTSVRKDVLRKILTDVVVRSHLALDTGIKGNVSAKKLISQLEKSNDVLDREVKRFFRSFLYPNTLAYTILIED